MYDSRETIWGIDPRDRIWFQMLTLIGGIAGSIIMIRLELIYGGDAPNEVARNLLLGITASFVSSGFLAWAILQTKDVIMAIGDLIRARADRIRQRIREEAIQEGLQEGLQQGIQQGIQQGLQEGLKIGREEAVEAVQEGLRLGREEGYRLGYRDAQEGKPNKPPGERPSDAL